MAYAGYSAAPWIPTWKKDAKRMMDVADAHAGETLIDLGSGDGAVLFAAAEHGLHARGVEIGIPQHIHAFIRRMFNKNRKLVSLHYGDLFAFDISKADIVIVYLLPKSYPKLMAKFKKELRPGARVVVQAWPIKEWKPVKTDKPTDKDVTLYLYTMGVSDK